MPYIVKTKNDKIIFPYHTVFMIECDCEFIPYERGLIEMKLNQYFDHTLLKPEVTSAQVKTLCEEAKQYNFYAICVNSSMVPTAYEALKGSDVKIAAVVGFPLGTCTTSTKVFETEEACKTGAKEIDMVLHLGKLKEGEWEYVSADIAAVVWAASHYGAIVKVILETCQLSDEEIVRACQVAEEAGAAFVKTSTGFGSGGATAHHVALMKQSVSEAVQVKASGGIRDYKTVMEMIEAGADRIGASASVAVMKEAEEK